MNTSNQNHLFLKHKVFLLKIVSVVILYFIWFLKSLIKYKKNDREQGCKNQN